MPIFRLALGFTTIEDCFMELLMLLLIVGVVHFVGIALINE